jgi:hypothetical protein
LDAACSDALNDEQFDRLEAALRASEEARRLYLRYCTLEGDLHFLVRMTHADDGTAGDIHPSSLMPHRSDGDSDGAAVELPHQLGELPHQPDGPTPEPLIPPIIIDTSAAPSPPLLATFFAPGGWAFSYAAATVVTGLLLLVLWAWTVSHEREFAGLPPHSTPPAEGTEKPSELVGRIIGTADCRWANPGDIPPAAIRVGRKYELAAGLLEISYDSGAKVILQGPCTYEVDSPAGGFLSLGKLTARLEKKGEGGRGKAEEDESPKSESRNPKSPFPPPPSPFVVRTPTATVTDLGTEFGVEVGKEGQTEARVFKGAVLVTAAASQGAEIGQSICREGEAVRVSGGEPVVRAIPRQKNNTAPAFVRAMPPPQSVRESRAYAELVLSLKPAVYYRMDRPENDKGRQLVLDSAPGGHHGELRLADPSGSPYVSGRFGDALWFCGPDNDRMSDRVLVFDYPKAANDRLTVSAWVMAVGRPEWAMIASNWGIPIGEHANTGQFQLCLYRDPGGAGLPLALARLAARRPGGRRDHPAPLPQRQRSGLRPVRRRLARSAAGQFGHRLPDKQGEHRCPPGRRTVRLVLAGGD